tara:strand:- start:500 stop:844 length:345 start_codon:yes stop_codon:yes gene_type:complete
MNRDPIKLLAAQEDTRPRVDAWKVRCWRELRNLSQHDLAAKIGYGKHGDETVCRIETYALNAGEHRAQRLAKALRVSLNDLQSLPVEWELNRAAFAAWTAAGRPDLRTWLKTRG